MSVKSWSNPEWGTLVEWTDNLCPKCKRTLNLKSVIVFDYPYLHSDVTMICDGCGRKYTWGIPKDRTAGLSMIIWTENEENAFRIIEEQVEKQDLRCPFHSKEKMIFTKYIGSIITREVVKLQWKCKKCFLTKHISLDPMEAPE